MADGNVVFQKSKVFALRIVRLTRYLGAEYQEHTISRQLLRSGTSIGANIAEAQCASSKRDFLNKMAIAYKECSETRYWLELLYHAGYLTKRQYCSVDSDAQELFRILSAITISAKKS